MSVIVAPKFDYPCNVCSHRTGTPDATVATLTREGVVIAMGLEPEEKDETCDNDGRGIRIIDNDDDDYYEGEQCVPHRARCYLRSHSQGVS
jgi:hypothetical protein